LNNLPLVSALKHLKQVQECRFASSKW
jgi:hypothetical protein